MSGSTSKSAWIPIWVSSVGSFVDRFEQDLVAYGATKYAEASCNGTAALYIALLVAGVQPNDEVLVSTLTFIAPVNAICYVGGLARLYRR